MRLPPNLKIKLKNYFPALQHKNFRYFWIGQCVSLIGTWMQNIGQSWLVLTLTKSPLKLGIVGALQFTPMLLFSLFAGVLIDKFPKRKILLLTQGALAILAFILSFLVLIGKIQYWHILLLATLLGCINAIDVPARQSFVIELVGKEHLINAIALNSTVFNAARIVGPGLAGILMGYLGIAFCFLLNALSFIPVIYGIYKINIKTISKRAKEDQKIFKDIWAGLLYIFRKPLLYDTTLLVAIVGTFAMNFSVLIPVFAKVKLNQQETGFGLLMSSMGAGSLIGALMMATRSKGDQRMNILYLTSSIIAVLLVIIGYTSQYYTSALFLMIIGFFNIIFSTTANSTIQLNTKDEFRGRVMSIYSLVFAGTTPIGNLFAGSITNKYGPTMGFVLSGIVVGALILLLFIFRKKGNLRLEGLQ